MNEQGYPVLVTAAIAQREKRILVAQRPAGRDLAGLWEFPGGKVDPGESPEAALARELQEELGVVASIGPICSVVYHRYSATKVILLLAYYCHIEGEPRSMEGQEIRWVSLDELKTMAMPAADRPIVEQIVADTRSGLGGGQE
ncbi:MAG: (deoxy)nucleoside triphosphate pyrophosphohydrolase [Bacillota bacterium]